MSTLLPVVAALASAGAGPASAASPPPKSDPFFVPPASYVDAKPGAVLRTRDADLSLLVVPLTGIAFTAKQVLYRTTDAHDRPAVSVTTLVVPRSPAPTGGRDLISFQSAEDSLDPSCAPSYQLQTGSVGTPDLSTAVLVLVSQLARGGAVVIPDHEGADSQLFVRATEGHAVLDSIRAVQQLSDSGLPGARTEVGVMGYSGGAHATASALELQGTYAPELHVVGGATGGLPSGDAASIRGLDGSLGAALVLPILTGLERAYPEVALDGLLNDSGRAERTRTQTGCGALVFSSPFSRLADRTTVPDVLSVPRVAKVVAANALGGAPPVVPTLVYNGIADELIKVETVDAVVHRWCTAGGPITYVRDPLGAEHLVGGGLFIPRALAFLQARFDGRTVSDACNTPSSRPVVPTAPAGSCASRRRVVVHPRIPTGARVRRMRVTVTGAQPRTLRGHRTRVAVDLRGRSAGRVRVTIRVESVRDGRRLRTTDRRTYRPCTSATGRT